MSRKTSSHPSTPATSTTAKSAAKPKPKGFDPFPKPSKPTVSAKLTAVKLTSPAKSNGTPQEAQPKSSGTEEALLKSSGTHEAPATIAPAERVGAGNEASNQVLNRAERDIASAIDGLNNQMNSALSALAQLASAQTDRGKAVVRTAPLDRATATFQRLVAEVVDDQFAEILPPLITLRNETGQWAAGGEKDSPEAEFHRRGVETLDHVLTLAGVNSFDARAGQAFDPLIHLAVGECHREDLAEGTVAECLQSGFRSSRGKVLSPARVRINRR